MDKKLIPTLELQVITLSSKIEDQGNM